VHEAVVVLDPCFKSRLVRDVRELPPRVRLAGSGPAAADAVDHPDHLIITPLPLCSGVIDIGFSLRVLHPISWPASTSFVSLFRDVSIECTG